MSNNENDWSSEQTSVEMQKLTFESSWKSLCLQITLDDTEVNVFRWRVRHCSLSLQHPVKMYDDKQRAKHSIAVFVPRGKHSILQTTCIGIIKLLMRLSYNAFTQIIVIYSYCSRWITCGIAAPHRFYLFCPQMKRTIRSNLPTMQCAKAFSAYCNKRPPKHINFR